MLTKKQAIRILNEEIDYEEKMSANLIDVSLNEIKNIPVLSKDEKEEVIQNLKIMKEETEQHKNLLGQLIDEVSKGDLDDY